MHTHTYLSVVVACIRGYVVWLQDDPLVSCLCSNGEMHAAGQLQNRWKRGAPLSNAALTLAFASVK